MNNKYFIPPQNVSIENEADERRLYIMGAVFAFILTVAAFGIVWLKLFSGGLALIVLGALALIQAVVHLHYFLHINTSRSHRDDLMLILFSVLIVLLMISGTMWILYDQHIRMML